DKENAYKYTAKRNLVAVVTDGTAVLGLGNIGPEAAMPVMEGKSILFKSFGNVDAFPICLDTTDTEEIIKTVKYLAPTFGGINLEDIGAPKCFEIEQRLEKELDIPVFHDDQHGTAIVVTAALLNAAKIVGKELKDLKVVLNGAGAAGTAILKMFMFAGVKDVIACDSKGTIYMGRKGCEDGYKLNLAETTNPRNIQGGLADALVGADVFVGVSVANCLTKEMVATMNKDPMVFAMANPDPEIAHDLA
ncbi:MAG: malic enzyme-like NAD(P)-binding protein, partial [Oscillospiraceae bacterium]